MLDLESLAFRLRQSLVIRDLFNQTSDFRTKTGFKFFASRLGVFDRVVKYGSLQRSEVSDTADATENLCHLDEVIDVWEALLAFSPLVAVFVGREVKRGE